MKGGKINYNNERKNKLQNEKEKTAAFNSSASTDEMPSPVCNENSIPDFVPDANAMPEINIEEAFNEMREQFLPGYMKTFTMANLYDKSFGNRPPIIDGLLYPGLYLFAGAPKTGKSFCMIQLAYHISCGIPLWGFDLQKNKVLYFALEDTEERLQRRLFRMFGEDVSDKLFFTVASNQIDKGLGEQLEMFVLKNPDTKVIIIDTLQKIRDVGGDSYSYAADYDIIGKLKKFADEHNLCMILVHHTRKQEATDKTEMISGTNGLFGAADGAFIMYKENRTDNRAVIEVSGRDQPDMKLFLRRNLDTLTFELERSDAELWKEPPDEILDRVSSLLTAETPTWTGTATELAETISTDLSPNALSYRLNIKSSQLSEEYHVRYERGKNHAGRAIRLTLIIERDGRDDGDGD